MEQKSLKVLDANKTFFSKITSTITKILIPTRIGINGIMISIKRNNVIKSYTNYIASVEDDDIDRQETLLKKYEETFALYLEAIDKYIIDSVYKKVKSNTASNFEREALSKYYVIVSLKDKQYLEYKYRKQEYLLKVDYDTVSNLKKEEVIEKYNSFYVSKMDSLYKGLLKNYSVQLSDTVSGKVENKDNIYNKIFNSLEDYISTILPIKITTDKKEEYKNILNDFNKYEDVIIGKLDDRDILRKKMILLGLSRQLFTHSLPLIAAEQCYVELIKEARNLVVNQENKIKKDKSFDMLIELIEDYNIKLLSTKVYWDKPSEREEYKKFWDEYKKIQSSKNNDLDEDYMNNKKKILFLKNDLKKLYNTKDNKIIEVIKEKLIELGGMRNLKNKCHTIANCKKVA